MVYVFDLLDKDANAYDVQIGLFMDDQAARHGARSLLDTHRGAAAVDIWDVGRRVARVAAGSQVQHENAS